MRRLLSVAILLVVTVSLLGACGDDEEKDKGGLDAAACTLTAPAGASTAAALPQGWPAVDGVTFTASATAGPTTVISGTASKALKEVFDGYKRALSNAPFGVTKSEKDKDDAEVNFESTDTSGQVKLRKCADDKTAVQVTARPK